jgi:VWFA-related protein
MLSFRTCVAALSILPAALLAQAPSPRATFRSSLELVSVAVVVRGSDGRLVPDLKVEDFEVLDGGAAQPIVQFDRGGDADPRLALLVDGSGSMVMGSRRERSRLATEFLIANLKTTDTASVFAFDRHVTRLTPFTGNADELRAAVTSVESFGSTSIYDAIVGTIHTVMEDAPRARALLLLTDGFDTASVLTPGDAATAAGSLDIPLYVLSVGTDGPGGETRAGTASNTGKLALNDLAARTGGVATEAATAGQLSSAALSILTELRHQYVIAFAAGPERGWHALTVRVRRGRVQARSRDGYVVS